MDSSSRISVVFFGSFQEYSALVLESLLKASSIEVIGVVTTPPHPMGRDKKLTPNHVHSLATAHAVQVFTPETLDSDSLNSIPKPDYFITAGYGKLIPTEWLAFPKQMSLNLHLSLLPDFRGANPAEWAILFDQTKSGVTLIEMSPEFDTGDVLAQATTSIEENDTRESLYRRLYELGGLYLPTWLSTLSNLSKSVQKDSIFPYSSRFKREDGFVDWKTIGSLMAAKSDVELGKPELGANLQKAWDFCRKHPKECGDISLAVFVARASRALHGFPSLWTLAPTQKGPKRLKIHNATTEKKQGKDALVLTEVQLEGHQTSTWAQLKNAITHG